MILFPIGLFAATDWGLKAMSNPGAARVLANALSILLGVAQQRFGL